MTLRQLRVILRHLPEDSAYSKRIRALRRQAGLKSTARIEDQPTDVYTQTEWLLIALNDRMTVLTQAFFTANFKDPPKLEYLPRPGGETPRRRTLNAWFGAALTSST